MNPTFPAKYCDGETLRSIPVELELGENGIIRIRGEKLDHSIAAEKVVVSEPLGRLPRFLRLTEGGMIEIPADAAFENQLNLKRRRNPIPGFVHWLESHASIAAAATVLLIAAVGVLFWQGLPRLGHRVAYAVPASIEVSAGRAGYAVFANAFARSQLDAIQQQRVRRQLDRLKSARKLHVDSNVYFFAMGAPNAFALPGGIIVVTDELVHLAKNQDQLAAVLAHELGHIELRHGLQSVLRNSGALIVVSTVTGDLSTLSTFSGTLPFLLLQYGYAREFESEADAYARELLVAAKIEERHLADILQLLEDARPTTGTDFSYLSTHPSTKDRIQSLRTPAKP